VGFMPEEPAISKSKVGFAYAYRLSPAGEQKLQRI
jgi:hypothetical protein